MGVNEWKLSVLDFEDGPYLDQNITDTTMTASAASGSITITASNTQGINNDQGFLAGDSGRIIRLDTGSGNTVAWGWGVITAVTSDKVVTVQTREDFGTTATTKWRLGAWSDTTGWPAVVGFFEQRVVWGNTPTQVDRFWMSKAGLDQVNSYAPTTLDGAVNADNAITYQIADDQVNAIHWIDGGDVLMIGTASAEYVVRSSDFRASVAPDDIEVKRQATRGSGRVHRKRDASGSAFPALLPETARQSPACRPSV